MSVRVAAACLLAISAVGCGGGGNDDEAGEETPVAADLVITVRPEGSEGPARRHRIRCEVLGPKGDSKTCRSLGGLSTEQLEPVPSGTACTQIFGGQATANVRGELGGRRVNARFALTNGCEIERWDRNRVLLGDPPARG